MGLIMKSRLGLTIAAMLCILGAAPAKATPYLYEINAGIVGEPDFITGSFTMDNSIGPTSVSNINIQATDVGGSFNFNDVYEANLTWPNSGYLWWRGRRYLTTCEGTHRHGSDEPAGTIQTSVLTR
jgi:hypothetical protein